MGSKAHLLCRAGDLVVAMAVEQVHETMRPLAVSRLPNVPDFILGVCVVRGAPIPVVDVQRLLGVQSSPTRFVTVRLGHRRMGMAFDEVLGVRALSDVPLDTLPAIATIAEREFVEAIGVLDDSLLLVLEASRVISESVWADVESRAHPA